MSGKDSEVVDLISTLPINTDHIQPFTFPKYEPEQSLDEEGNLMVGGVALKQFDVKPIDIDYHLQQYEEHPILKLKVRIYMYMSCTWYDVPSAYLSKSIL